ncbi:MAG: OmpA family protein [Flavobacteriales bacterium]|jgi:OmpA-OmpF porin, OOP family|nr:OmpA family protein [Flavobacteriales bacterium]MBT4882209.1 OmpA family protein [Flavobacteriales bacterium]
MNSKSTLLVVVLLCCCSLVFAQDNAISNAINKHDIQINKTEIKSSNSDEREIISLWKGWSVGFGFGVTQFDGDIRQHNHYPAYQKTGDFFELKSAVSFSLNKQINSFYSLSAEFISGSFSGLRISNEYLGYNLYDPYQNYEGNGDKFSASFNEADLMVNIDISNVMAYFFTPKKVGNLSFDAKLGLGYNIYNSVRKNLFSDTYIYSFGYQDEGANSLGSDYGTIKKGIFSAPAETVYIYGILAKYKLNSRLNLVLDYTVRNGKTDKWDASIMNTQNLRDKFNFLSVGIAYKFGNHDYNNEWESPIDGLKDDVTTLFVKIDGFTDDADNDGVSDAFDKSPNTPLGVAVDGSGNALDVDMDNVPDYRDADPFSNRGAQVDENGVELDDDKDGVPNSIDLESNTPVGTMVNQFGINISSTTYVSAGGMIYFPSIYFNLGSAIVGNSNENRIATMALMLKNNPDIKLNVVGHTDNIGTPRFNKRLGLKRANAVINYLVVNYNVDINRLSAITKGEENPLSDATQISGGLEGMVKENTLAEINRRVDFEIAN